jgi:hypothetical protein
MKEFSENRGRITSIARKTVGSGQSRLTEAAIPRYRSKGRLKRAAPDRVESTGHPATPVAP